MEFEVLYNQISAELLKQNREVRMGKMMSSEALKIHNKVFTFFYKDEMGFRLGKAFDPQAFGLLHAKPLSPFKTKAPLKGWFMVGAGDEKKWGALADMALEYTSLIK